MTNTGFNNFIISEEIRKALAGLGYKQPTEVQRKVIPIALEKKDLIVKSQTGSGKTASFSIPICEMADWEENKPQCLILTPTRELAAQVKDDIINIGRYKRIKAAAVYGKQPFTKQKVELSQKTHVVVGTPGRVLDHIEKGTLKIEKLKFFIIDEADEMLNMGFIDQVEAIIRLLPPKRVTWVFSATFPEDIRNLCYQYLKQPTEIETEAAGMITDKIEHVFLEVPESGKLGLLKNITIVENPDSCIIFCKTQERVNEVCEQLDRSGYPCDKIHGGMYQEDRFEVMNDFKRGDFRYLVATDVAARGIDIENVSLVINYDIPSEKESYVHRTGRTGRAGKGGKALTFMVRSYEESYLADIEKYIGLKMTKADAPLEEEINRKRAAFEKKINARPIPKTDKSEALNQGIMKLYFNGGKKKKIRAVDFVGTIAKIDGVTAEDIGIIRIEENASFVEILNGKGPIILNEMRNTTIKGKQLKVHPAKK